MTVGSGMPSTPMFMAPSQRQSLMADEEQARLLQSYLDRHAEGAAYRSGDSWMPLLRASGGDSPRSALNGRQAMRVLRSCAAGILPCLMAAAAPAVALEATPEADRFDCRALAAEPAPQSALDWYELSLWAGHCYRYDAHAVRIGFDGVRTLVLSHEVGGGLERGHARFLDGPPMAFERRSRIGRLGWSGGDEAPATPEGIAVQHHVHTA